MLTRSAYVGISRGFGHHIDQLSRPKATIITDSKLLIWNLDLFYAFSLGCSKLSVLSLYWRLFHITSLRNPIRWVSIAALIWIILRVCNDDELYKGTKSNTTLVVQTFLNIFMCVPVNGYWDETIDSTCNVDEQQFFFGTTLTHLVIDVTILCLPIWQVCQLRLETLPKIGLCITFGFGTM